MRLATERGYCDRHLSDADAHGWDPKRGNASERGYGWKWAKLRQKVLSRDAGLCQRCFVTGRITPACQVDHILPRSAGGSDAMDNLQAICDECHRVKTITEREAARLRARRQQTAQWPNQIAYIGCNASKSSKFSRSRSLMINNCSGSASDGCNQNTSSVPSV